MNALAAIGWAAFFLMACFAGYERSEATDCSQLLRAAVRVEGRAVVLAFQCRNDIPREIQARFDAPVR